MPTYRYVAVDEDRKVKGRIEGFSAVGVTSDLLGRGLRNVKVRERRRIRDIEITATKVKPLSLMQLSRQLAAFVRAGVTLLDALDAIRDDISDKALRTVVAGIADSLRRGDTLSAAADRYEKVLPPFYTGILRTAEVTGRLDEVLDLLASYLERDLEAKRKLRSALSYPAVILVMSIVTVVVLTGFVLPRFTTFFEAFDAELPLPTRMLLWVSGFFGQWWPVIGAAIGGGVVASVVALRTGGGKLARDRLLLRLPVVGDVVRHAVYERFCRLFGSMVKAGVPVAYALEVTAYGTHNGVYQRTLGTMRQALLEGEGIAVPLARSGLFPAGLTQMMRVGESTGTLDDQLDVMARFYASELEHKLKRLTTLFEPAVIVLMGLIVGFVAIALVSAMYGVYNQVDFG